MDRKQGVRILYALGRAGLLRLLASDKEKLKNLSTPDKLYCGDPNLMHALAAEPDEGTLRETFFLSQLETVASVTYPARGDFLVDGKWLFEVGGPGKTFGQIADVPESYLAVEKPERMPNRPAAAVPANDLRGGGEEDERNRPWHHRRGRPQGPVPDPPAECFHQDGTRL